MRGSLCGIEAEGPFRWDDLIVGFSAFANYHGIRRDSLLLEPELTSTNVQENVILKDLPPAFATGAGSLG